MAFLHLFQTLVCVLEQVMVAAFAVYLWHSEGMKALKSPLASELLADPSARDQLRRFLETKRLGPSAVRESAPIQFEIHRPDGRSVKAIVVPKAKAA